MTRQDRPSHHQLCRSPVWPLGPRVLGSSGAVKKKMLSKLLCFRSSQGVFLVGSAQEGGKNWNMTAHRPIVATLLSKKKRVHSKMIPNIPIYSTIFLEGTPSFDPHVVPFRERAIALEPNEMHIDGRRQPRKRHCNIALRILPSHSHGKFGCFVGKCKITRGYWLLKNKTCMKHYIGHD